LYNSCIENGVTFKATQIVSLPFALVVKYVSLVLLSCGIDTDVICFNIWIVCRFQEPGRAERDFERTGTKISLGKMLYAGARDIFVAPEDKELMESLPWPKEQPPWITDFDIQLYTEDKEKSGWTGGLNYYRCMDKSHELKAPWIGAGLSTKALFIAGDEDLVIKFPALREYVDKNLKKFVPNLKDIVYLSGGHFIQQEQAAKVNELLIDFLKEHSNVASQ